MPARTISAADDSSRRDWILFLRDRSNNGLSNMVFSLNASQLDKILFVAAAISAVSAFCEQEPER